MTSYYFLKALLYIYPQQSKSNFKKHLSIIIYLLLFGVPLIPIKNYLISIVPVLFLSKKLVITSASSLVSFIPSSNKPLKNSSLSN